MKKRRKTSTPKKKKDTAIICQVLDEIAERLMEISDKLKGKNKPGAIFND